jgi:Tol biopolymer transport system component
VAGYRRAHWPWIFLLLATACSGGEADGHVGVLAFHSLRDGNSEIYVVGSDGSGLTNLTNNPADDLHAVWSPDGSRIAFISTRDRPREVFSLYVMDRDGSSQMHVQSIALSRPSWSPDSTRLAYVANDRVHVTTINPPESRTLNDVTTPSSLAWSPDGQRIAFIAGFGPDLDIYETVVGGGKTTRLTRNEGFEFNVSWSPDSSQIAFARRYLSDDPRVVDGGIYVVGLKDLKETRLTREGGGNPVWSPDGRKIAYESYRVGYSELWLMNADGSNQTRIRGPASTKPDWSPDGRRMAYVTPGANRDFEVWVMNADGSGSTRIAPSPSMDDYPDWAPQ